MIGLLLVATLNTFSQQTEQWMTSKLEGNPVGYYYMSEDTEGDITTSILETKLVLNRLNNKIEMITESSYTEDLNGLLRVEHILKISDQETKTMAEVIEGGLKVISSVNGANFEQILDNDQVLYGPSSIKIATVDHLKNVGDTIEFSSYVPEFGKILSTKRVLVSKSMDRLEVKDMIEGFPEMIYQLDRSGNIIQLASRTPFGMMETSVSSMETAKNASEGTILPDEIFDQTMVRNNVRFADARAIDELVIKVSGKDKSLGLPNLEGSNQELIEKADDYVILKITRPEVDFQNLSNPKENPELVEFLEPNAYITSNNDEIQGVVEGISTGDVLADCQNLQNWVSENMNFDLGIVLAPASEVIKNKKGTCSEYTTLLTSLYRANNIPARMAMGFVYMNGIWGGHAWPEVYIDNQWVPFDAAIPGKEVADAARLRFASSSLADGPGELNGKSGIQMYGNAIIETLSYKVGDREYFQESDKPYLIDGQQYVNKGLGLRISIPSSFGYEDQDDVWPESRFLSVKGSSDEKVTFYQRSILPGQVLSEEMKKAVAEITDGEVRKRKEELRSVTADGNVLVRAITMGNEFVLIKYESENAEELANKVDIEFTDFNAL